MAMPKNILKLASATAHAGGVLEQALTASASTAVHLSTTASTGRGVQLTPRFLRKASKGLLQDIDLMVCDMAGTTVEEGGQVYETLQEVMVADGLVVSNEAMHPWHGAKKEAVIAHFAHETTPAHELNARINRIGDAFLETVKTKYFDADSKVTFIRPDLPHYLTELRNRGIKVALDTGYPPEIQKALIDALGFEPLIDGYISAYQVKEGRPYPYMIHQLMEQLGVESTRAVCKVGDSVRDIEEGRNAGCGLVVGVLSGADDADSMLAAGADIIANCLTDLPLPSKVYGKGVRLPDLS